MLRILLAGSALVLVAPLASAQEADSPQAEQDRRASMMERCAQIETPAARLACFDQVMRGGEAPALPQPDALRSRSAPMTTASSPAGAVAPTPGSTSASGVSSDAPANQAESADGFGRGDSGGLGLPGLPSLPDLPSLPGLGLSGGDRGEDLADAEAYSAATPETQIIERDRDGNPDKVLMTVDRVSIYGYNTRRFHMTNGQVWEVTDGDRFSIPRGDDLTAEIRTAGAGGYFMRLNGEGRAIRVRRID